MSLLTDIRDEIIDNITGIATDATPSGLGLDDADSIHPYLHEWEKDEKKSAYLAADVDSKREVRSFGVQVTHEIVPYAQNNIYLYTYTSQIELYYPTGETGVNNLINAFFAICQEIINGQVPCLVDNFLGFSELSISKIPGEGKEGEILQGIFTVEGEKRVTVSP